MINGVDRSRKSKFSVWNTRNHHPPLSSSQCHFHLSALALEHTYTRQLPMPLTFTAGLLPQHVSRIEQVFRCAISATRASCRATCNLSSLQQLAEQLRMACAASSCARRRPQQCRTVAPFAPSADLQRRRGDDVGLGTGLRRACANERYRPRGQYGSWYRRDAFASAAPDLPSAAVRRPARQVTAY